MLHKLRNEMGLTARVFEAGGGVGGTWYWNRYPGARSDSDSYVYGFTFDEELWREWQWSERYPEQHEIRAYLEHVAERFDLDRDITFDTRVESATFDEATNVWTVVTDTGETVTASYVITAVGALSASHTPPFAGIDSFRGRELPHRPVAAREGRLHRQARGRHRHRRERRAGRPADREGGLGAHRLPAHRQLHPPGPQRAGARGREAGPAAGLGRDTGAHPELRVRLRADLAGEGRAGVHRRGDPRRAHDSLGRGRVRHLGGRLRRHLLHRRGQRQGPGVPARAHPGEGARPGDRAAADPDGVPVRGQACPARLGVLRDVQRASRPSHRREVQPDRRDHARPA